MPGTRKASRGPAFRLHQSPRPSGSAEVHLQGL